jgi:hypothetical protein
MEYINHFGSIRARLKGTGNIKGTLYSYDEINSNVLVPFAMSSVTANPVTLLTDFTSFVAKLEFKTTEIDEIMDFSQIIIYSKPVANSFPM